MTTGKTFPCYEVEEVGTWTFGTPGPLAARGLVLEPAPSSHCTAAAPHRRQNHLPTAPSVVSCHLSFGATLFDALTVSRLFFGQS